MSRSRHNKRNEDRTKWKRQAARLKEHRQARSDALVARGQRAHSFHEDCFGRQHVVACGARKATRRIINPFTSWHNNYVKFLGQSSSLTRVELRAYFVKIKGRFFIHVDDFVHRH